MLKLSPLLIKVLAGVAVMAALYGGYKALTSHYVAEGREEVQALWDADKVERKKVEQEAIDKRLSDNEAESRAISERNEIIESVHNEELSKVRSDLATARRLRVGPAICGRSTPKANTESPASSIETNPGGGVVGESIERDIRALMLKAEEGFAAGRACQSFVHDNGLM